ncbi:hypothetical protein BDZ91DRAFT_384131 [Kalaharituber pfeilii]|nr:hypothetical protein BDZ91DRAFT_384131 [Kalaharituber pfeilii]
MSWFSSLLSFSPSLFFSLFLFLSSEKKKKKRKREIFGWFGWIALFLFSFFPPSIFHLDYCFSGRCGMLVCWCVGVFLETYLFCFACLFWIYLYDAPKKKKRYVLLC